MSLFWPLAGSQVLGWHSEEKSLVCGLRCLGNASVSFHRDSHAVGPSCSVGLKCPD
jgi:hypothetical protein